VLPNFDDNFVKSRAITKKKLLLEKVRNLLQKQYSITHLKYVAALFSESLSVL